MKIWQKTQDGSVVKYRLTKEYNPDWWAMVFMKDGRWTFELGKRIKEGDPSREFYSHANIKKWKSLATAKSKALMEINIKSGNTFFAKWDRVIKSL